MKVLALVPSIDAPDRYNYQPNYNIWDAIEKITEFERAILKSDSIDYGITTCKKSDVCFLPMNIRLKGHEEKIQSIKKYCKTVGILTVMFDNDDLRRPLNDPLYEGIDIIFSRMYNENGRTWLPWCVDTEIFTPVYGGEFISMPASIVYPYSMRIHIKRRFANLINLEQPTGSAYIKHLQRSKAVICTGSDECRVTRAKVLEAMACGALIITERTEYLENYFGNAFYYKLAFAFDNIDELPEIINHINNRKDLATRQSLMVSDTSDFHSSTIQARKVVAYIESFLNGKPDKDILHSIQNPLE